jgi:mono/diheme cytochrome c family protein
VRAALPLLLAAAALLAACDRMTDQPRSKPYRGLPTAASLRPEGTVARAKPAAPPTLSLALIERGRERFDINCAPCHGRSGDGRGMIVERGFPAPPSYHIDRLRNAPSQHFYDVITNGYGAMYSYAARVPEPDRWAIVAYIRALQQSQNAALADVPAEKRRALQ